MKQFEIGSMYYSREDYFQGKIFRYNDINQLVECTDNNVYLTVNKPDIRFWNNAYDPSTGKNKLNLHYEPIDPNI